MNKFEVLKLISDRGDIWLTRIEKLKHIYLSDTEPKERRLRAFNIAFQLNARVAVLMNMTLRVQSYGIKFEEGGYTVV